MRTTGGPRAAGRPRVPVLDRTLIAEAGLLLLDARGADGFTMAELARELGVRPSAIYNHVSGKEEVLASVRELVSDRIDVSAFATRPWFEAVPSWAKSYREAFAAHPPTVATFAVLPIEGAARTMGMYETVTEAFLRGGWPADRALSAIVALESFILGSALDAIAPVDMLDPGADAPSFPNFTRAFAARKTSLAPHRIAEDAFTIGLTAMIAGLRSKLDHLTAD